METKIKYYDDGVTIKMVYTVDENGIYQEAFESYHGNGQLKEKCAYKDDKKDGPYEQYYENGQLKEKCAYKDGEYDGPYEAYYDNGQLKEKFTNKDGRYNGPHEMYYKNGQLYEKCTYKNGKFDGSYEEYDENGQPKVKCTYKDGQRVDGEDAKRERHGLNKRLEQINKQMKPTQLRQAAKRTEVAKFRAKYREKSAGK